jgi:hypothetical protein
MTLARFLRLSITEYKWLIQAAWAVLVVKIALRFLPFETFRAYFDHFCQTKTPRVYDTVTYHQVAWAIRAVSARWPWRAVCLPQALAFKYILRRDASLHLQIGVNKRVQGQFQAHAWVEKSGKILIGDTPETFQKLWTW